jgi:small multidrug resistance pump
MDEKTVPGWVKFWFYGAAVYNVVWGIWVVMFPGMIFDIVGMERLNFLPVWQGVGMMVMVYGLGYYYLAIDPERYGNFIWIGLLGKTFGPIGGIIGVVTGQLPLVFCWVFVFNDLMWWPAFWIFALKYGRKPLQ